MTRYSALSLVVAYLVGTLFALGLFGLAIIRQTPVGTLVGTVAAEESGNLIPAWVSIVPTTSENDEMKTLTREVSDGHFRFDRVPAGNYILRVDAPWRRPVETKIKIEEGKIQTIAVEVPAGQPDFDVYMPHHILIPGERGQLVCNGYVESEALQVRFYRVGLQDFLQNYGGDLRSLVGGLSRGFMRAMPFWRRMDMPWQQQNRSPSELTLTDSFTVPVTKKESNGTFARRIRLPELPAGIYVFSISADQVVRYDWLMVTSLGLITKTSGPEVLAMAVNLKTGTPVPGARVELYSGNEMVSFGRTDAHGIARLRESGTSDYFGARLVVASAEDSFAFVSVYSSQPNTSRCIVYSYTDRPVYRPGHRVFFRGIARESSNQGYLVPAGKKVTVTVQDPNNTLIYQAVKTIDAFGCWHGEFTLNPETISGIYTLSAKIGESCEEQVGSFAVASYAKPEFSVKISFPKKRYTRGELVRARVKAEYYFGMPVSNARIRYYVTRSSYWFGEEDELSEYDYASYEDYGGYGEPVDRGKLVTDRNGEAVIFFRADWPLDEEEQVWDNGDQRFTVDAYVEDASGREQTATASVLATRGEFAVFVKPDRYVVQQGSTVKLDVEAKDYNGRPVGDQSIELVVGRERWTRDEVRFDREITHTVSTNRLGRATFSFVAKRTGDIRIIAAARDERGNRISGSAWVWCLSGEYQEVEGTRYGELTLITDKKKYAPGETAKLVINTVRPGAVALVTVEREKVYDYLTVPCRAKSTVVKIPIREGYKPNFYIGVCFVRNKTFTSQQVRLEVSLRPQTIRVTIKPNKACYGPGEKATCTIITRDASGKPVDSQLSVGVVDEAIYAIREEDTMPILDFFYSKMPNSVSTQFSFPQVYFSGPDKGEGIIADPRASSHQTLRIRKRFLDTAFWKPDVRTGPDGRATISFTMPDNLTRWRATVRAITLDTKCGQAVKSVVSKQDMLVRLQAPRFLVKGDTAKIVAVVHNYTGYRDSVEVSFKASGLKIRERKSRRVTVPNDGYERVEWTVFAQKPGSAVLQVSAVGDRAQDAVQLAIPVYPHGEERRLASAGALGSTNSADLSLPVRQDAYLELSRLKIRLAPSLASAMLSALEYLAQYPYGCTEQTVSSFLPDVVLYESFGTLGIRNPALKAKLPDMVRRGLLRLYRLQMPDGGWGWCDYGKSDPWMTAYACYALICADRAGFSVNEFALDRALEWLTRSIANKRTPADAKAFACYVLALEGENVSTVLAKLSGYRSARVLAYTCLAYSAMGSSSDAANVLERLFGLASVDPAYIYWRGKDPYLADDIETTALALQALLKVRPGDPRAYRIVAWLMNKRRGTYWYSTRDTAMTLYAMSEFLKVTRELAPKYQAEVIINGAPCARVTFEPADIFRPDKEIVVKGSDLRRGTNRITINKIGPGNLYYSLELVQWIVRRQMPVSVMGSDVWVTREYRKLERGSYEETKASRATKPITRCSTGDVLVVKLTIGSKTRHRHLLVEDFVPAGCEIVDRGAVESYEWEEWYVGRDVRDNKISFYVDDLPPGKRVIEYQMRAFLPGQYCAMPAKVFGMYDPSMRFSTEETRFAVK
jgi:uncharacterized protein YfaS (alpha-2-macroglobulin family)